MRLSIERVGKTYRTGVVALADFELAISPGVLGLLGPNGAGKSTLMRILATLTPPSTGRVLWNGIDVAASPRALRSALGYLPQDFGVYPHLSAVEFLRYLAAVRGLSSRLAAGRIEQLLEMVNLKDAARRPLGELSGGMRQRVGIAQAFLCDPQVLIIDEPTVGLDPEERVRFRDLLSDFSGERIVILSTHIVSDVEAAATEIAIIDRGRLVAHGLPEQFLRGVEGKVWEWIVASPELPALKERFLVSGTARRSDGVHVRVVAVVRPVEPAQPVAPNLEDAYLFALAGDRGKAPG
jgi:ABC-type multidrug transport system ATPase subunit